MTICRVYRVKIKYPNITQTKRANQWEVGQRAVYARKSLHDDGLTWEEESQGKPNDKDLGKYVNLRGNFLPLFEVC